LRIGGHLFSRQSQVTDTLLMLDQPKQAIRWTGWRARSNHAGHLVGVAELLGPDGVTLPGYTLQIEIKAPVDTNRCLFLFSIMRLHQKRRLRVYQLEVAPHNQRTHNGAAVVYGPHEHISTAEPTAVDALAVRCDNWVGSLQWFFNRTSVQPFPIEDPHHVQL
jgi:hypothetical protein